MQNDRSQLNTVCSYWQVHSRILEMFLIGLNSATKRFVGSSTFPIGVVQISILVEKCQGKSGDRKDNGCGPP